MQDLFILAAMVALLGSNPIDEEAADILDDIQPNHVENTVTDANKLDATDNGQE